MSARVGPRALPSCFRFVLVVPFHRSLTIRLVSVSLSRPAIYCWRNLACVLGCFSERTCCETDPVRVRACLSRAWVGLVGIESTLFSYDPWAHLKGSLPACCTRVGALCAITLWIVLQLAPRRAVLRCATARLVNQLVETVHILIVPRTPPSPSRSTLSLPTQP